MALQIFGFRALWSPYFFIFLVLVLVGYFLITIKYREKFLNSEPLKLGQAINFSIAILLLYIIKGSPIDLMGHLMFYAHMIQMAILCLVIPKFFITGIPPWIWRSLQKNSAFKNIFNFLTKPVVALILFNGIFSIYHIPLVFDIVKTSFLLHAAYTSLLFVMAIIFWWPIDNKLDEYQSLSGLKKVGYIFAASALLLPACGLIIFANAPLYSSFSDPDAWAKSLELCVPASTLSGLTLSGPEMFSSISLLNDQQLGGIIMKMIQEIVYGVTLAQIFFSWYRKEQEETEIEKQHSLNPQTIE
ncbi:cytochrome c oxidase assembly factor CtaG [Bacillus sp. S/N-304-OC-R1]|uniref:cytochrome c oxidase assembly factor CtaG n=1 Tax=Bacillus sp. S/N-304-OC-R1 TaxID=2758034 RepID=UPI001C8EBC9F|nr:cytochrome c oxidase assembly factor CtaG [Bacillus sp. S/N-304-OC-R1]MBY0120832.1 cytochrome c oxidase assembly factor CtaG [Bacillus sp. S/N-304-OC-R1]